MEYRPNDLPLSMAIRAAGLTEVDDGISPFLIMEANVEGLPETVAESGFIRVTGIVGQEASMPGSLEHLYSIPWAATVEEESADFTKIEDEGDREDDTLEQMTARERAEMALATSFLKAFPTGLRFALYTRSNGESVPVALAEALVESNNFEHDRQERRGVEGLLIVRL